MAVRAVSRDPREASILTAFLALLETKGRKFAFVCHPDEEEQKRPSGTHKKAPDYLYQSDEGHLLQIEYTQLAWSSDMQARTARLRKIFDAIQAANLRCPPGSYQIEVRTDNVAAIRRLLADGTLQELLDKAETLHDSPLMLFVSAPEPNAAARAIIAHHTVDPRFYASDEAGAIVISKTSPQGCCYSLLGPPNLADPDHIQEICDPDTGIVVEIPSVSRPIFSSEEAMPGLELYLDEAQEKFGWREGAESVLLLDIQNLYVAGPRIVLEHLQRLDLSRYSRISDTVIVFDHPWTDPPVDLGELSDGHRFLSIRSRG